MGKTSFETDEFMGQGTHDVIVYAQSPEHHYFGEAMRYVDEGRLSVEAASRWARDSVAHHYNPRDIAEPALGSYVEMAADSLQ